jgi:hypothetical protein
VNNGQQLRSIVPYNSTWTTVYFIFDTKIVPATFNESTNTYVMQPAINIAPKSFGIDSLDRIWLFDLNQNLHVLSPSLVSTVTVTFASASYNYTGNAISTSINVSAYNYQGTRLVANVRVTIDSENAKFSDGSTNKLISTSASADITQNINILGAGQIKLHSNIEA